MVQPVRQIASVRAAARAARALGTPSDVRQFEAQAISNESIRAFMSTPEWAAIRGRIIGDGRPPMQPRTLDEFARFFRWTADGVFDVEPLPEGAREAYLHAAAEIEAAIAASAAEAGMAASVPAPAVDDAGEMRDAA